jgi:DNA polymerase III subunit beta
MLLLYTIRGGKAMANTNTVLEFACEREQLQKAVKVVSRALGSARVMPILGGIKFDIRAEQARLFATDLDQAISYTVPLRGSIGEIVLSGEILSKIAYTAPGESIYIKALPGVGRVEITSGSARWELPQLPLEDYPEIPQRPSEPLASIARPELARSLELVTYAVLHDKNASRLALTGVYMILSSESIKFVATNGYRMAVREVPLWQKATRTGEFLVPAHFCHNIISLLPSLPEAASASVNIYQCDQYLFFEVGPAVFTSRIIEEEYPDFDRVIPKDHPIAMHIERKPFVEALKRAQIIAAEESEAVILAFEDEHLEIRSQAAEKGETRERIPVQGKHTLKICFRAEYLLDALKRLVSPQIVLWLADSDSAGMIVPDESDRGFVYVIMPIRLDDI